MPSNQHSAVGMEQQLQKLTQAILARGELLKQLEVQCAAIQASVEEMKPNPVTPLAQASSSTPPAQASSSRSLATGELDNLMPAKCSMIGSDDDTASQKSALMPDAALGPPSTATPLDVVITNIEPIVDALLVQDDTCVLTSTPSGATFHSIDLGDKHVPKLCCCQLGARKLFDEMLIRSTVVLWPPPMKLDERQLWPPPSRWVIKCSGEELRPTPWPLFTCNRVGLQLKSPWPPPEQNRAMGSVAQQSTPWLSLKCYWNVTPPDWQDSVGIITLLVINSTISFIEENNAGNAAAALMAGLAAKAKVLRDGRWTEEEAAILVPQDIVSIKLGDIIPADARLLEGDPLKIDQSALTGESLPVTKGPSDGVYSGSTVKRGEIEANEIAPGVHTLIGKAAHLVDSTNQVGQFQKVLTAIWNFCICSIVVGMFDSVTFRRTQESAARHEDLQQKTGLVEAIIVEIQDRDKVGGSYLHSDAICCTPELDKEKSCKVGEVIIRPNPGNPDWPKRIQTFFDGKNEEILMVTQSVSINKTGMYYLYFMFCDPQHKGLKIIGRTVWRNPHGYLPGKMAPMMTFCGFMSLAYLVLGLLWFLQFVRCWKDILQLHYHITAVIALGMCEMAFWYFEYANFNSTGTRPMGITLWAVTFTAVKKTVSRLLLLVVSMGYGVVRPTLGGITSRVAALGVIYFIASEALELVENLGNINDFSGKTRLFLVLPVAILDATFIIWIFSSLSRTLEKLQLRRSMAKLELYRKFTNSLAMAVHILEENLVKMVGANENVGYKKNRKPADIHCGTGANSGVFSEDSVTVGDLVVKDQEVIEAIREPSITFMVAKEEPLTYFTSLGYQCPDHVNPAEFLDDLISIDYSSAKSVQSSQKWIENLIEEFANKVPITECSISVTKSEGAEFSDKHVQKSSAKRRHGCWRQFRLLFKRAWMQIFRDGPTNKVRARMSVASAIIFGSVFWRMGKTQTFIQQDGTSSGGCHKHSNGCTDKDSESFPEGTGYNRERAKGSYALGPYLSSKWLAEIPIGAAFPLILGSILYPMAILLYRLGVKPHFKERGMSRTGLAVGWLGFGLRRGPGPGGKRGIQLGLEKTGDSDGSSRKKHYGLASALFYLQLLLPPNPLL